VVFAAGLAVANGICINANLRTTNPQIFTLNDYCAFPDPETGAMIRLESVQAATEHARCIARAITTGQPQRYAAVPWFWSDQADWKLQIAGLAGPDDSCVAVGEHTVLRFCGARLSAVETINDAKTHMKARKMLAGELVPGRDLLAERNYDLTAL
jgi:3-phenylpropionate/trans-cinnamate dioxygenase ferredoxin reductase component